MRLVSFWGVVFKLWDNNIPKIYVFLFSLVNIAVIAVQNLPVIIVESVNT